MMSAPMMRWFSTAFSGVIMCSLPSIWERNRIPRVVHLAQRAHAECLEPTAVGQHRARPTHEAVDSAETVHGIHPRTQVEMVGVG